MNEDAFGQTTNFYVQFTEKEDLMYTAHILNQGIEVQGYLLPIFIL